MAVHRWSPRRGKILAIIAAALLSLPPQTRAEVNKPAVEAAMGIWAFVEAIDVQIEQCRQIDPGSKASYDRAYVAYHQGLGGLMVKIDFLLIEEASRLGAAEDFFTSQLPRLSGIAAREAKRMATSNQGLYIEMCRSVPKAASEQTDLFRPLREKFPEDMSKIDGWR